MRTRTAELYPQQSGSCEDRRGFAPFCFSRTPDKGAIHQGLRTERAKDDLARASRSGCSSGDVSVHTRSEKQGVKPLFTFSKVVTTPGALAAIEKSGQQPGEFLDRHQSGDWGDVPPEDIKENELSLKHGFRLPSVYLLSTGIKIWVITDADRSSTTVLLPEDY